MANLRQLRSLTPGLTAGVANVTLALAIVFGLAVVTSPAAQAQTFQVIHNFTGGADGGNPSAGVTMDKAGNLYGTTFAGGNGYGTVYQMKHRGSGWTFNPLYSFTNGSDGATPSAPVVFGSDGALYSTAEFGGHGNVFKLRPSAAACKSALCPWSQTVLYAFQGGTTDGSKPIGLVFDQAGNLYGTTSGGGTYGGGTAYQLTPSGSGWTESVLHSFGYNIDGSVPYRSVMTFDSAGNLYGSTYFGGSDDAGTIFQLTPSGSGWIENVIYNFQYGKDGGYPYSGLTFDPASGNLYGTTTDAGTGGGGTIFELSPSGGGWTFSLLYSFTGPAGLSCGPDWALVMDGGGNLYGTTQCDGTHNAGNVFKLTNTGGGWTYTSLYDFTGGNDGANPISGVTFDSNGNLYGTTYFGGPYTCYQNYGCGVLWEITP